MIKLITFDLDNTLWPVNEVISRANKALMDWLQEYRPEITQAVGREAFLTIRQEILREKPEIIADLGALRIETIARAARLAGLSMQASNSTALAAFEIFMEQRNRVTFFPHAEEVISQLSKRYSLIALSNGNADLNKVGIGQHFDAQINAAKAGFAKPHPRMFELALAHGGFLGNESIHIGDDHQCDIAPAVSLGMHTIWANIIDHPNPQTHVANAEITALDQLPSTIKRLEQEIAASC